MLQNNLCLAFAFARGMVHLKADLLRAVLHLAIVGQDCGREAIKVFARPICTSIFNKCVPRPRFRP
jgi:hypothetical protein